MINRISSVSSVLYRGVDPKERKIPQNDRWCVSCKFAVLDDENKVIKRTCTNCKRYDYGMPTQYQKRQK